MRQQGFSFIELLIGLSIIGIVLAIVTPAFATLTESTLREEAAKSLISGIRMARTEAITRNQTIVIHAIEGDWSQGWRIIRDLNGEGAADSNNPLLFEHQSNLRSRIFGNRPVSAFIRFSALGEPLLNSKGFQAGTIHLCATREPVSLLQITLASSGRVSLLNKEAEQALCQASPV